MKTDGLFRKIRWFGVLVLAAVGGRYLLSDLVSSVFFIFLLILYLRSDDEPFWFAFFLTVSDGVFGFFGPYEAVLTAIPGLPEVEVGQFYILLSVIKATMKKPSYRPFYQSFLIVLLIYLIFLVAQGYVLSSSIAANVQLRTLKLIVPLLLLYSLPRLLREERQYQELFAYLFPVAFLAFFAQVFTIIYAQSPPAYLGLQDTTWWMTEVDREHIYRGIYSVMIILITFFGALYFLARRESPFGNGYLITILMVDFTSVVLSATRGWIIGMGLSLVLFFIFVWRMQARQLAIAAVMALALGIGAMFIPVISLQFSNTVKRMQTLEALASGDLTAGGTLLRLEERGPRVMRVWRESPITGWGFSEMFYRYEDGHVGNQNILLHAGIIGGLLLAGFFAFFFIKHWRLYSWLPGRNPYRDSLLVFGIFLLGWFAIHSSSRQFFAFYCEPAVGMIQGVFFSLAGLVYYRALRWEEKKRKEEEDVAADGENTKASVGEYAI